jgi:hypothetical protein
VWSGNPKTTIGPATLTVKTYDNLSGIAGGEYFIGDADPGFGNGTAMSKSGDQLSLIFGANFATGVYKVTVRAQDMAGNWSLPSTDYLVVYNPFSLRMTGKHSVRPLVENGDVLPGLAVAAQSDVAAFGFTVGYDAKGNILPKNDFQLSYNTGTQCNKVQQAAGCHSLSLNATSITWFTTQGINDSIGICEGIAVLSADGVKQQVTFQLTVVDGERVNSATPDHLDLRIFPIGANISTDQSLYHLSDDVLRGSIHIKT